MGSDKCATLHIQRGSIIESLESTEFMDSIHIQTIKDEPYKYLGINQTLNIKIIATLNVNFKKASGAKSVKSARNKA